MSDDCRNEVGCYSSLVLRRMRRTPKIQLYFANLRRGGQPIGFVTHGGSSSCFPPSRRGEVVSIFAGGALVINRRTLDHLVVYLVNSLPPLLRLTGGLLAYLLGDLPYNCTANLRGSFITSLVVRSNCQFNSRSLLVAIATSSIEPGPPSPLRTLTAP